MDIVLALAGDADVRQLAGPRGGGQRGESLLDRWVNDLLAGSARAPTVLAIDGGYRLARQLGLEVTHLIGDLDSIDSEDLAEATAAGTAIDRWPQRKDFTDLELGLRRAESLGATSVTCLGGAGGRVDHLFTNLFVLAGAAARMAAVPVRWICDEWSADFLTPLVGLDRPVESGTTFSVLTPLGDAEGVTISGASFPLERTTVHAGAGIGLSNVARGGPLDISLESGTLSVVWPRPERVAEAASAATASSAQRKEHS